MSEGKMREEFEAWYRESCAYAGATAKLAAWAAWQASRAALEIELPHPYETAKRYMDAEAKFSHKEGIDECRAAIEAAGVRAK